VKAVFLQPPIGHLAFPVLNAAKPHDARDPQNRLFRRGEGVQSTRSSMRRFTLVDSNGYLVSAWCHIEWELESLCDGSDSGPWRSLLDPKVVFCGQIASLSTSLFITWISTNYNAVTMIIPRPTVFFQPALFVMARTDGASEPVACGTLVDQTTSTTSP
jgi:hypothetical protein